VLNFGARCEYGSRPVRFTPGKDLVNIVQEALWVSGPVWMGVEKIPCTHRGTNLDRPARSPYTLQANA